MDRALPAFVVVTLASGCPFEPDENEVPDLTLSDSSAVQAFAVGQRSEGHGVWRHDGGHSYAARWVAMIQFDTPAGTPPGSPGFVAGWQVATNTVVLSGPDSFTSNGVSEFFDLNGQVYRVGCASRVAERFK